MTKRKAIPQTVVDKLLFRNRHACCICREPNKDVQVHHIDSDPSNNAPGNLAVLCLDCHSKVTSDAGLGRRYTPGEVRLYKQEWESLNSPQLTRRGGLADAVSDDLLRADISRLMVEVISINELPRKLERLTQLETYAIYFEVRPYILDAFHSILLGSVWSDPQTTAKCTEALHHLFWGLAGPETVELTEVDLEDFNDTLKLLNWIAEHATEEMRSLEVQEKLLESTVYLFDLAVRYDREELAQGVLKIAQTNLEKCHSGLAFGGPWTDGIEALAGSLTSIEETTPAAWEETSRTLADMQSKLKD